MAAGTLSVTNNSKAVVGEGTTFTAFKAGDFLTLVVGQVPYTIAISSIESDTALTLVLPFDGPTATDLAWDGVKRDTMSLATMGVTVQAQKALRLMIADENNWRAIFGDAEEITVTLPNGQVMQGMSWGYLSQLMKQIVPVEMRNLQQQQTAVYSLAKNAISDERLKSDITDVSVDKAWENIAALHFVNFIYKSDEQQRLRRGIIAQPTELIEPLYVKTRKFYDDNNVQQEQKELDTTPMLLDTMHVVQTLMQKIEAMEAEISALKK